MKVSEEEKEIPRSMNQWLQQELETLKVNVA
jgi:hypothetical protein